MTEKVIASFTKTDPAKVPAKKTAAKPKPKPKLKPKPKPAVKKVPSTPKAKPKETVKHPFGTCVPLGECICNNNKGEK